MVSSGDFRSQDHTICIPFLEPRVWSVPSAEVFVIISREIVGGMRG